MEALDLREAVVFLAIAGLVIHEAQMIPEKGQVFTFYGFTFEVMDRERNQMVKLRITPLNRPARR